MQAYADTFSCMIAINLCYAIFIIAELRENVHVHEHLHARPFILIQKHGYKITHFIDALSQAQLYFVLLLMQLAQSAPLLVVCCLHNHQKIYDLLLSLSVCIYASMRVCM